jgi:hypothetical protein
MWPKSGRSDTRPRHCRNQQIATLNHLRTILETDEAIDVVGEAKDSGSQ